MRLCLMVALLTQVALIHKPSQSLIPADTFAHMAPKEGAAPKPSLPPSCKPFLAATAIQCSCLQVINSLSKAPGYVCSPEGCM